MNCPDCDAASEPVGDRNDLHRPECGLPSPTESADGLAVVGEPIGAALCPVCRLPLVSAQIADETVCYCRQCRGFLAKNDTFAVIVTKRRALHGPHEQRTDPFDAAALGRVLTCPSCQQRMETHPYFGGGNAVVDTCEGCGLIWLDEGELAVIERYLPHVYRIERTHTLYGGRYQGES
jgi:Zn-finger nucleic acid-binding protein